MEAKMSESYERAVGLSLKFYLSQDLKLRNASIHNHYSPAFYSQEWWQARIWEADTLTAATGKTDGVGKMEASSEQTLLLRPNKVTAGPREDLK